MKPPGFEEKPGEIRRKWSREFGPFLTLGLQLAITVVVFFFLGQWLDSWLGTEPWLMLGSIILGVTGSLIKFIRTATALGKRSEERGKKDGG